jgi:hypothetical protein
VGGELAPSQDSRCRGPGHARESPDGRASPYEMNPAGVRLVPRPMDSLALVKEPIVVGCDQRT